ncbi:microtubule-associated protein 1 light chain 3 gamma-like [Chelonoidis abingdonii]|uniref:microtubule-associated protein 1 light chain 3 gamma-like n=1 Tax=Chelonoidis abingdonii TaxID=106734 RepID=UPI0013F2580A|nr:microtubule-associated proteins 1A/1B light chain 3C-like [Chelonoidis abingdonii]
MLRCQSNSHSRSFKQRKSLASRMREAAEIRVKYPTKIPVVAERYQKEKQLPLLDRTKFLVSQDSSMSQFVITLRTRMSLTATQAFYLLVNNKNLLSMSMGEVYRDHKDDDGFLYVTYASQEIFGCCRLHGPAVTQS